MDHGEWRAFHYLPIVDAKHLDHEVDPPVALPCVVEVLKRLPRPQNAQHSEGMKWQRCLQQVDCQAFKKRAFITILDERTVPVADYRFRRHDVCTSGPQSRQAQ